MSGLTLHDPMFIIQFARDGGTWGITQRVLTFEFADAEKEMDECRITLAGETILDLIDHPKLLDDEKTFLIFKFGYIGAMSEQKQMVITSLQPNFPASGAITLDIIAHDKGRTLKGFVESKVWTNGAKGYTESELVEAIAKKHGLNPVVEPTKEKRLRWTQGTKSDLEFIDDLCKTAKPKNTKVKGTYKFYVEGDNLFFKPSNLTLPPVESYTYFFDRTGELISFEPSMKKEATENAGTESVATGIDTRSNAKTTAVASNATTDSSKTKLADKDSSKTLINAQTGSVTPAVTNKANLYK